MDYLKNGIVRHAITISLEERHQMIKEFLETDQTKVEIWRKHTGQSNEHGSLLRWMRMYGYVDGEVKKKPIFTSSLNYLPMSSKYDNLDTSQLQAKIKELEKQLQDSKLKEEGYRTMIEIAEKAFKIPIIKKSDTK